ncbi:hypothetical protein M1494_00500 [Candidatus Parvarchaeota archaeon]|nr:hypothetical protein [Candidatus Parvarchaeota archaeon]
MVNVRLKQALALFIAIAFVSSIFFFFPHVSSTAPVSYYIVVPSDVLSPNSSYIGNPIQVQQGVSDNIIAYSSAVPVSTLSADNISNMLEFTESMLSQENISYNLSNGNIQCLFSKQFTQPLCANASEGTSWFLIQDGSNTPLLPSSVKLSSINSNSTFILVFFTSGNSSSSSTTIPKINLN